MPYKLDGNCVVKADGSPVPGGCHATHEEAVRHLRALYANVEDAKMFGAIEKGKPKTAVHTDTGDKLKIGDVRHIADAITALGPGFRGNKVQLSPDERSQAISRIRGAIEALSDDALKKHLLERLSAVEHGKMFHNVKSASGERLWRGIVSVNTYDREDEVASAAALEGIVKTLNLIGVKPELWPFHLTPDQRKALLGTERAPGVTDWFDVVNGHLVAVGHWHDDPISKAWGDWVDANPDSHDGSGWGMSWVFGSNPDADGIFNHISYAKEFTFLPLSQAAHPLTRFTTTEVNKMSLTQEQEALIAAFKHAVLGDPIFKAAAQTILEADSQSQGLDLIGVERKSADAQTMHGPDGLVNQPGAENGKAADSAGKCPKCGMKLNAKGECPTHGDVTGEMKSITPEPQPKPAESAAPEQAKATGPVMPQPKPGLQPSDTKVALGGDRPLMFSDLKELYKAVEGQIKAEVAVALKGEREAIIGEINKALQPRDNAVIELAGKLDSLSIVEEATLKETWYQKMVSAINEQNQKLAEVYQTTEEIKSLEKAIQSEYGTPRILEQWKNLSAANGVATVLGEGDPLASSHPAVIATDNFTRVGLKPANGRAI